MPFFTLTQLPDGTWRLLDNHGQPFFSLGLNHIDESNLLHPHNIDIHDARYPTRLSFIEKSVARIQSFGFNTLGWTQEYVVQGDPISNGSQAFNWPECLHSTAGWSQHELKDCGMPYMVVIPVMENQDWTDHPHYREPSGRVFEEWCDYLARSICNVHKDSELCVGYFFVDIPGWARHETGADFPSLKDLSAEEREETIYSVAESYYRIMCNAVRKVDPNHLIFGDRYNGNRHIPEGVLMAMKDHVDVLSVQYFCEPTESSRRKMAEDFQRWHELTGKPVLNADIGNWCSTRMNPQRASALESQQKRAADYALSLAPLMNQQWCVGWHWCGYIENKGGRGWGLVDPFDEPYSDLVETVTFVNQTATTKARRG